MDEALDVPIQPVGGPARRRGRRRLVAVVIVVAGLGLLAGFAWSASRQTGPPGVPAHRDRIAFVDEDGNLAAIGADGSDLHTFPAPGVTFRFPAWSPDGTRILAVGGDASDGAVYVADDVAGATPGASGASGASTSAGASSSASPFVAWPPSTEVPIYASWSPDGRRIGFLTNEPDGLALRTVAADGIGTPTVVRRGAPMYWDWIDDGHLLVHTGDAPDNSFLGEVGVDGSAPAAIPGPIGVFQAPGVSTDGDYRAYVADDAAGAASVVIEARHGGSRVTAPVGGPSLLAWSPVGDQLAYTAPASTAGLAFGPLRLLDARSGATRTLLDGLVVSTFWAPDGRTIAVLQLVVSGEQTAAATPSPPPGAASLRLSFVDVDKGSVRSRLPIALPDLEINQFLPFSDQYALSHLLWSPASDAIVLPLVDGAGHSHVTIVPADGSAPRALVDGVSAFWSP